MAVKPLVEGLSAADIDALRRVVEERGGSLERCSPARESLVELFRRRIGGGGR